MDMAALMRHAEAVAAVAGLAEALKPAVSADIRHLAGPPGIDPKREVVITLPNEAAARACYLAIQKAAGKLA